VVVNSTHCDIQFEHSKRHHNYRTITLKRQQFQKALQRPQGDENFTPDKQNTHYIKRQLTANEGEI